MKKSNLLKIFWGLVLSVMVILMTTTVHAAEGFQDMTGSLLGNNTSNTGNTGNTANTGNTSNTANTNSQNTNTNSANTNRANTNNANTNSNKANTNNSSIYNNTNLPKTGIGDSLPIAALVVVFGISAVYAYKKIKDYRNI